MKIRKLPRWLVSLLVLTLVAAPVRAAEKAALRYLGPTAPDVVALLAPPPESGTAEAAADLEEAYLVYHARTAAERAQGLDEVKLTPFHFAPVIGPWFVPGHFPKTEALFKELEREAKAVASTGKKHWQRLRPYHADPARFTDPIEHEERTDYSYPSGHSTRGTLYALVLAELFPGKREALLAKGRETGWLRVLGGVHYPTDIYAGRVLGQALARDFIHSDSFQRDLAEVRTELAAAK